MVTMNK